MTKRFNASGSIIAFGDSITSGVASSPAGNVITASYMQRFANNFGTIANFKNYAISSTYICDTSSPQSIYNRLMNLTDPYDTIFIAGGVNNYAFGRPLGSLEDTASTTFYGCLRNMCRHLMHCHANSTVFFITLLAAHRTKGTELFDNINPYRNAIYEVATQYGFSVIDGSQLGLDSDVCYDFLIRYIFDGYHPTADGHELVAKDLYQLLKSKTVCASREPVGVRP